MKRLVIFDLDGTLLNTIADLADSTNYALQRCGFPIHETQEYNFFVGNGINKLFERALPEGSKTEENIQKIRKEFLIRYNEHNANKSMPYPGIPELLADLRQKGLKIAVASNKYHVATQKLVSYYFPSISFSSVLGQREGIPVKPDPAIVNEILSTTGIRKEETLYVGDSGVDMQTANNAGITSVGVTWGFRAQSELETFQPSFIVHRPEEIKELL